MEDSLTRRGFLTSGATSLSAWHLVNGEGERHPCPSPIEDWVRVNQRPLDAPHACENLGEVCRRVHSCKYLGAEEPLEGRLSPLVGERPSEPDRRAVLLTSESRAYQDPEYILGWVAAMLGLEDAPAWKEMQPVLRLLLKQIYREAGDLIALVEAESIREPIAERLRRYEDGPRPGAKIEYRCIPHSPDSVEIGHGISLPGDQLRWEGARDRPWYDLRVTRVPMQRTFEGRHNNTYDWESFCLATPWLEDRASFEGARFPLYDHEFLPHRVRKHRLVVFGTINPIIGRTPSVGLDLNAKSGALYSIRPARNDFSLWSRMDVWLDEKVSNAAFPV